MRTRALGTGLFLFVLFVVFGAAERARAFPGFYVSGASTAHRSDASTVVLMRDGDRTVVSMRSDYQGPLEDFAWVVPVPPGVGPEQVRTLRPDAFDRIERLSAPRLVEYWERDPCAPGRPGVRRGSGSGAGAAASAAVPSGMRAPAVTVEARFAADEYDVVILDTEGSAGLVRWLRELGYRVPDEAEAAARPYVDAGYRFLVARVDSSRVRFDDGRPTLTPSPLRFHYRSEELVLPIRLGRVGAAGPQDLVVHVLARGRRYEVANRANVLAPTNLVALERARSQFDEVYATIVERVLSRHPGAVITEYAWQAQSCDPCPTEALDVVDLDTFGRDVIGPDAAPESFVLTRLHAQIDEAPETDLVLRPGPAIAGGRGRPTGAGDISPRIDRSVSTNAFQARYAILHRSRGTPSCASPIPGRWGAPPRRRRPAAIAAHPSRQTIQLGRMRRYLRTWTPVLRIPIRGDAAPATEP